MQKYNPLPNVERLRELLSYNKDTGILHWNSRRPGVNADLVAGVLSHGYIAVRIDGVLLRAHRVIWKLVTGQEPVNQIDHKDLNRANNAWLNLREADNSKNMMNAGLSSANTSGFKGVVWDSTANRWRVRIKLNQKYHYVGIFRDFDEAVHAMKIARVRLHGEFARAA